MRHWWISFLAVLLCGSFGQIVFAEEEDAPGATILEKPSVAFDRVKAFLDTLDPVVEGLWNFLDGDWQQGYSVSLYNWEKNNLKLAALRAGYGVDKTLYGSPQLDVAGALVRFIPESHPVGTILKKAVGYVSFGPFVGYNFGEEEWKVGFAVGGKITLG